MKQHITKSGRRATVTYTMVSVNSPKQFDINEATFLRSFKHLTKAPHGTATADDAKFEVKKKNIK